MAEQFNVLNDNWIPVLYQSGISSEVGIRKLINDAPEIEMIRDDYALEKIAIIRLLTAFLSDAYHLQNRSERFALLKSGKFDEKVIEEYISRCISEHGASFELFDDSRPFMTSKYDSTLDGEPVSVAEFCPKRASGNNTVHFDHHYEDETPALTYAEAIRAILSEYLFCFGNRFYSSSVNNTPPIYYAPAGGNLFRQLVMCMRSEKELGNISLDEYPAAWNSDHKILHCDQQGENVAGVSFLSAMTLQTRRIVLIPENGMISKCYFSAGLNFQGNDLWKDPFVAYFKKKDGSFGSVKPTENRALWRSISNITAENESGNIQPRVLRPLFDEKTENVYSIGVVLENGAYKSEDHDYISIPYQLMTNEYLSAYAQKAMAIAENLCSVIPVAKTEKGWKGAFTNNHALADDIQNYFLVCVRKEMLGQFFTEIAGADLESFDWENKLDQHLRETLVKCINRTSDYAINLAHDWKQVRSMQDDISRYRGMSFKTLSKALPKEKNDGGN